jgi:hypothetical protein
MNAANPTPALGEFETTNPCGETQLLPYESCNLASVNLARMVAMPDGRQAGGEVDEERLRRTAQLAIHFLDNVVELNRHPLPEIAEVTRANRKVGLGVMGFAEMLIRLGVPYDSERALEIADRVMRRIDEESREESRRLAEARGPFPSFTDSVHAKDGALLRNATRLAIAPTGTISIIAGVTGGIEPVFAVGLHRRNILDGSEFFELHPLFEELARREGFHSEGLVRKVARAASVAGMDEVPEDVRRLFRTAHDVAPEWHVRMQAAYGEQTLDVCKQNPERVAKEVKGLSRKRADEIAEMLRRNEALEQVSVKVESLAAGAGLSRSVINRIIKLYREEAPEVIKANPYRLIDEVHGVGFLSADRLAIGVGFEREGPERCGAAFVHVLQEGASGHGDVYLPEGEAASRARELTGVGDDALGRGLEAALTDGKVVRENGALWLARLHADELYVATKMRALLSAKPRGRKALVPFLDGLQEDQIAAARGAARSQVAIVTGAPGVGKTWLVARLVTMYDAPRCALRAHGQGVEADDGAARGRGRRRGASVHDPFPPRPARGERQVRLRAWRGVPAQYRRRGRGRDVDG